MKKTVKEMNIAEKTIEIAQDCGLTTKDLLKYDVAPSPLLFSDDGCMTKPEKSQFLQELETHLKPWLDQYQHQNNSSFIIDVMATIRKIRVIGLTKFEDLIATFVSFTTVYHQFG